jgi:hypothetical protein
MALKIPEKGEPEGAHLCNRLWVLKKYINKKVFLPAIIVIAKSSSLASAKQ